MRVSGRIQPQLSRLEDRCLPSTGVYPDTMRNDVQASYATQARTENHPLVLFGDSITFNWGTGTREAPGSSIYLRDFATRGAVNFGIPGDTTQDLLGRIRGGDFAGHPRLAVVMIGVNDLYRGASPEQTETGVEAVVHGIQTVSPETQILLLGILPTDLAALNPRIEALDALIARLGTEPGITYLDPGASFRDADGQAIPDLTIDGVHPTEAGYRLIAQAIAPTVAEILGPIEPISAPVSPEVPLASPPTESSTVRAIAVPLSLLPDVEPAAFDLTTTHTSTSKARTSVASLVTVFSR